VSDAGFQVSRRQVHKGKGRGVEEQKTVPKSRNEATMLFRINTDFVDAGVGLWPSPVRVSVGERLWITDRCLTDGSDVRRKKLKFFSGILECC